MWRRPDGRALVATLDFFTPIVDDARTWGRIAAANSVSDVYAMGGRPLFALNIVAWPRGTLPLDLLGDVLAGGAEVADEGGWVVAGGHSVDGPEPMYGQSVTGEVDEARILTNVGAEVGQALVLTKALGTGIVATAIKRLPPKAVAEDGPLIETYRAAIDGMTRLNGTGAEVARASGATTVTDVTGFGLLGHLQKMLMASGVGAALDVAAVPIIPGAWDLLDQGYVPGGTQRNIEFLEPWIHDSIAGRELTMLADAQTSGGLLFACSPSAAADAVAELRSSGHAAAVIGEIIGDGPGRIRAQ